MKILTLNCGSSTLKFQFVEVEREETSLGRERRLAYGTIDRIVILLMLIQKIRHRYLQGFLRGIP